jgi:hypothetical protein
LALVVVLGYARERLEGPAGHVFTIGAAMLVVENCIETWFMGGLALHAEALQPATARTLLDVASMWGPILTIADVLIAVPILLAALAGRFPRWLGALAAVFAAEQLIEVVTVIGSPGSFIAPGGAMNLYAGGFLFVIFFLALGISSSQHRPDLKVQAGGSVSARP